MLQRRLVLPGLLHRQVPQIQLAQVGVLSIVSSPKLSWLWPLTSSSCTTWISSSISCLFLAPMATDDPCCGTDPFLTSANTLQLFSELLLLVNRFWGVSCPFFLLSSGHAYLVFLSLVLMSCSSFSPSPNQCCCLLMKPLISLFPAHCPTTFQRKVFVKSSSVSSYFFFSQPLPSSLSLPVTVSLSHWVWLTRPLYRCQPNTSYTSACTV